MSNHLIFYKGNKRGTKIFDGIREYGSQVIKIILRFSYLNVVYWNIIQIESKVQKITRFIKIKNDPKSINSNNVFFMTKDSSGNLWIATYGGGLNKINADKVNSDKPKFIHYLDDLKNEDGLLYQDLKAVYLDNQNQLWIGSQGDGVYKIRLNATYQVLKHETSNPNGLSDNRVYYIYNDSKGNIWAFLKDGILNKWEKSTPI